MVGGEQIEGREHMFLMKTSLIVSSAIWKLGAFVHGASKGLSTDMSIETMHSI